jgi:hypothetical protein
MPAMTAPRSTGEPGGGARGPRLVFANLVNELMIGSASPAYAQGLYAVSPRKIWLAYPGDVVVTPRPIGERFKAYACDLLGVDPSRITTLSPEAQPTELLAEAVLRTGLHRHLADLAARHAGLALVCFALDEPTLRWAEEVGATLEGFDELPSRDLRDALYRLNTKSGFRQAAQKLGLPTAPGEFCEGFDALLATLRRFGGERGGVIVKFDRSSNGYGHLTIPPDEMASEAGLRDRLVRHLAAFSQQPSNFTVEAFQPFTHVPSVEMVVEESGVRLLYVCDQRCRNASFFGMVTPPVGLPASAERELLRAGEVFGDSLRGLGYRGVFDVDAGLTDAGQLFVTETNLRRTGGTYLDTLVRRLVGERYPETQVWWADARPAGPDLGFFDGWAALGETGLAFSPERGRGVVLTADTMSIDRKWRYLIIAHGADEAREIETALEALLRLPEVA